MRKKTKKKFNPDKIFAKIKNTAAVDLHSNDRAEVIDISWTLKDVGFGHITLVYDKKVNKFRTDTECTSLELLTEIIRLAAPKIAEKLIELDPHTKYE